MNRKRKIWVKPYFRFEGRVSSKNIKVIMTLVKDQWQGGYLVIKKREKGKWKELEECGSPEEFEKQLRKVVSREKELLRIGAYELLEAMVALSAVIRGEGSEVEFR